jgi:hypothetical protein
MMRWLRGWLYSDDEIVRVATGLMEPEAEMWREVLEQAGIRSFTKTLDAVAISEGRATGTNVAIFVKQSDLARAEEVLAMLKERGH